MTITRSVLSALALVLAVSSPARLAAQEKETGPETVMLKGSSQAGVKFTHGSHATKGDCVTCHHAARPEKAPTGGHQKCGECHVAPAAALMKTSLRGAFHNQTAKQGTCIDCHIKETAAGKPAPLKCAECHKKENG